MLSKTTLIVVGGALLLALRGPLTAQQQGQNSPMYTAEGRLLLPSEYREWVYLSSGVNMSYGPGAGMAHNMFDNVFVNPEAYKTFIQTGTWPDKTVLVLEVRGGETKGSINKNGVYQNSEVMGIEAHVKDEARFQGKWAFFGFDDSSPAKEISHRADCYTCHEQHGAVDTTFVQFYPTLLEIAKKKGTLSGSGARSVPGAKK